MNEATNSTEDGTFLVSEPFGNETSSEWEIPSQLGNGTNNATTFLDDLSNRAGKLRGDLRMKYSQKEVIGIAVGTIMASFLLLFGCSCCFRRKIRRGTNVSKKRASGNKEPLVMVLKVEERPWTSTVFKGRQGKIEFANGDVYEGGLRDGQPHGWGVLRSPDANHEGEWKYGKKHGKGVLKFADGDAFEGDWKEGQKIGGKYTWSSSL
jgi:hypothetical protein